MTTTDRCAFIFRHRPNEWISALQLAYAVGLLAWRTRISDVRKLGMDIENKTERDPFTGTVRSYYRYNTGA